jgi:hypothetical protein
VAKTDIRKSADPTSAKMRRYIRKTAEPVLFFYYSFKRFFFYIYMGYPPLGCREQEQGESGVEKAARSSCWEFDRSFSALTAPIVTGGIGVAWAPDRPPELALGAHREWSGEMGFDISTGWVVGWVLSGWWRGGRRCGGAGEIRRRGSRSCDISRRFLGF